ncbi:MAG TPA: ferritin family protein [Anaerohalosphaeraceae bacterium]|nr:ferritin family protein [Anaerohalosphaeraceae bacterium]HRT48894.1 ferritin family protein [Anaerohalosphaeraceae bacterium]HRT85017.1 ferritin family protein [Anaerohalosphaeraceae bacterium]
MLEFRSIEDVLKFAIQKEETSYFFYMDLADGADEETAQLFSEIAQEELKHRQQLQLEMMKLGRVIDADEKWLERSADYVLEERAPLDFTGAEALKIAITKEQAAYRLYIDLIRVTQNQEIIEAFMIMAEEEIRHKLRFEAAYDNYTRQEY